jgi:heme O synthase-like polyprenyltransferase
VVTAVKSATWVRWRAHLVACTLAAAALTAFLMHLGAADPWLGGVAVPVTVWLAWFAVDMVRASRRRARESRDAQQ